MKSCVHLTCQNIFAVKTSFHFPGLKNKDWASLQILSCYNAALTLCFLLRKLRASTRTLETMTTVSPPRGSAWRGLPVTTRSDVPSWSTTTSRSTCASARAISAMLDTFTHLPSLSPCWQWWQVWLSRSSCDISLTWKPLLWFSQRVMGTTFHCTKILYKSSWNKHSHGNQVNVESIKLNISHHQPQTVKSILQKFIKWLDWFEF